VRAPGVALALIGGALAVVAWAVGSAPASQEGRGATELPVVRAPAGAVTFRADAWALPDEVLLGFVEVPAGPFPMGSDPQLDSTAFDNELWAGTTGPQMVEVSAFHVGRYEVTVAQFRAFVEATSYPTDPAALDAPADYPVANVTWPDAVEYARWLDTQLRESSTTPPQLAALLEGGARVSLPTEAEWEKAARGLRSDVYPWGNGLRPERANIQSSSPRAVGSYPCDECPHGLLDMIGNVWEWTLTPFQAGPYRLDIPSPDLRDDALGVMRGGSFTDPPRNARTAVRGGADPGARRPFIGFRVVIAER